MECAVQAFRRNTIELLADVVVARQPLDAEQRPAGIAVAGFLEHSLAVEERRGPDEEHRKRGHDDVVKGESGVGAADLECVGSDGADSRSDNPP